MDEMKEGRIAGRLAEILALAHGTPKHIASQIRIAATLHDIGKQKIPKEILEKPGPLTEDEFEIIKTHTTLGAELLAGLDGDLGEMARDVCLYHHERYDGNGYWGRRVNDLPFYIAYVAIADVFTALISKRPYKKAWPPHDATGYIEEQSGMQFSPELVEVFLWLVKHDRRIKTLYKEVKA